MMFRTNDTAVEISCGSLSAPRSFRFDVRANNHKKLFLLPVAAIFFYGCPDLKENPAIAVRSALFTDIALLRELNVKSVTETKYLAEEISGEVTKGDVVYIEAMIFNAGNTVVELSSHNAKGALNWKRTCRYDNDKLTEVTLDSSDGSALGRTDYRYDEKGVLMEIYEYVKDYIPIYNTLYWYEENGNLMTINEYSFGFSTSLDKLPAMKHEKKTAYSYDGKGNRIESKYSRNDKIISENYYTYNDTGYIFTEQQVSVDTSATGPNTSKITYRYDLKGNLLEKNEYDVNGERYRKSDYKFEFDEKGIWIKQTAYVSSSASGDGSPVSITERKIEYDSKLNQNN